MLKFNKLGRGNVNEVVFKKGEKLAQGGSVINIAVQSVLKSVCDFVNKSSLPMKLFPVVLSQDISPQICQGNNRNLENFSKHF